MQIQGFFDIPLDHLLAAPVLIDYFKQKKIADLMVATADVGGIKQAWQFAERLQTGLAIVDKKRTGDQDVKAMALIGDVRGKNVIIPDDMIATASTLATAAKFLRENGAKELYACCTHPVFSGDAVSKLKSVGFKEIVVTNTIPLAPEKMLPEVRTLSIANLFGEAILRIHNETSVSSLFA